MGLRYSTVTGVARDDLPDGGAWLYAETVRQIHALNPGTGVELLIPDFNAIADQLAEVFDTRPEVLAHNLETVPRIFKRIRPAFRYDRSLDVLTEGPRRRAGHQVQPHPRHGRDARRGHRGAADLHDAGCEIITITQYLRPTPRHHPVERWVKPEEFVEHAEGGRGDGLRGRDGGPAGPLVLPGRAALRPDEAAPRRGRCPRAWSTWQTGGAARQEAASLLARARAILTGMAGKPAKADKEAKKAAKREKRAASRMRYKQLWQAFQHQRREDKLLLPLMIGAHRARRRRWRSASGCSSAMEWVLLPLGIAIGAPRRRVDLRTAGAELGLLQGRRPAGRRGLGAGQHARGRGGSRQGIAGTTHLDAVHRVIGRPGVILVAEGAPHRVKRLLAQEKKRTSRVVGSTPIYDFIVGNEEGQTPSARSPEDAHQAPAQHLDQPDGRHREAPRRARLARRGDAEGPAARGREDAQRPAHGVRAALARSAPPRCAPRGRASRGRRRRGRAAAPPPRSTPCAGAREHRPTALAAVDGATRRPSAVIPALAPNTRDRHGRQHEPDTEHEPPEPGVDRRVGSGEHRGDAVAR